MVHEVTPTCDVYGDSYGPIVNDVYGCFWRSKKANHNQTITTQ